MGIHAEMFPFIIDAQCRAMGHWDVAILGHVIAFWEIAITGIRQWMPFSTRWRLLVEILSLPCTSW